MRGVRDYAKTLASRAASHAKWSRWARAFAGVAGRAAVGSLGTVAGVGYLGYQAAMAIRKRARRTRPRMARRVGIRGRLRRSRVRSAAPRGVKRRMGGVSGSVAKRRRFATRSVTRRPTMQEYSHQIVRSKRPRRVTFKIAKALTVDYRILRWQRVLRMNENNLGTGNPPGSLSLPNLVPATGNALAPVWVFDLNHTLNTSTGTAGVGYMLQFTQGGLTTWVSTNSETTAGTLAADPKWQVEYGDSSNTALNKRYYSPRWYDIRLMCHGAMNQPTLYEILVVRFVKDHLTPATDGFTSSQPENVAEYHGFWQGMAKRLTFNPIVPRQGRGIVEKGMRVLKRVSFLLPATQSTDNDKNPACRSVRMFVPDGRLLNYQASTPYYTADNGIFDKSWIATNPTTGERQDVPISERARTFLIVRAMNTTATVDGVNQTVLNTPSFDIVLRKKEAYDAH